MIRDDAKFKLFSARGAVAITSVIALSAGCVCANIPEGHQMPLKGPWELVVRKGMEGQGMRFPVSVSDENKSETLDMVLPVAGMPIEVKLEQYLPNLKWETMVTKRPGSGVVAELVIKSKDLQRSMWLNSDDLGRRSISSPVGAVAIKRLNNINTAKRMVEVTEKTDCVGIVTVWPDDANAPVEYAACLSETVSIPGSSLKLMFLDYMPHYSIDIETKKVVNASSRPVNPAIKVKVDDGQNSYEQWLWSKFPSPPHEKEQIPLRMEFSEFELAEGSYVLLTAPGADARLVFVKDGKRQAEKVDIGRFYPFSDKEYSFSVKDITEGATIETRWKNDSEKLVNPALVASIEDGGMKQEIVLELNKAQHLKTGSGTIVLLYRRQP